MSKSAISIGGRTLTYFIQISWRYIPSDCVRLSQESQTTECWLLRLERVFPNNAINDHTFYNAYVSTAPSNKMVQDEYPWLVYHHLNTITKDIKRLLDAATADSDWRCLAIIIVNDNAQCLAVHVENIPSDILFLNTDILAIIETWMDSAATVNIHSLQLVHQFPYDRHAGLVVIYKRNEFAYTSVPLQIELTVFDHVTLSAMFHVGYITRIGIYLLKKSSLYHDLCASMTWWCSVTKQRFRLVLGVGGRNECANSASRGFQSFQSWSA